MSWYGYFPFPYPTNPQAHRSGWGFEEPQAHAPNTVTLSLAKYDELKEEPERVRKALRQQQDAAVASAKLEFFTEVLSAQLQAVNSDFVAYSQSNELYIKPSNNSRDYIRIGFRSETSELVTYATHSPQLKVKCGYASVFEVAEYARTYFAKLAQEQADSKRKEDEKRAKRKSTASRASS